MFGSHLTSFVPLSLSLSFSHSPLSVKKSLLSILCVASLSVTKYHLIDKFFFLPFLHDHVPPVFRRSVFRKKFHLIHFIRFFITLSLSHSFFLMYSHTLFHTHALSFSPFLSPPCTPMSVDSLLFQESRLADCKVFSLSPSLSLCLPPSLSVSLSLSLSTLLLPEVLTWNSYVCEQSANVTVVANTVTLLVSRSWSSKKESLKHQK